MRGLLLFIVSLFVSVKAVSQEDSVSSTRVSGRVLIANAGFAPIPAFSFNSFVVISSLSIKKKRFSYEPDFSLGLNGKPWMANNWFRFSFIENKKGKLNTGINPSFFFKSDRTASGKEIFNALRNLTFEAAGTWSLATNWSLSSNCMLIHAFDPGALSGVFFDISSSISALRLTKTVSIDMKPELFYFDFAGKVDGLFTSTSITLKQQMPVSVYFQGVLPLWSDFPGNSFKWNAGFIYDF